MEITNGFSKGMIKDVGELLRDPQSYEDALDFRLNSNSSASDYIMTNIKGNEFSFSVPDIPNLVLIEYDQGSLINNWSTTVRIETATGFINGPTITGTSSTDIDDFFDKIKGALEDPIFSSYDLNIARIGNRIRIWSFVEDITDCVISYTTTTTQSSQSGQVIIGWDKADNDIYLLTTNDTTETGGVGAIWKLLIDEVTLASTVTLLYSEALNFSTQHPIANPGGIVTVHETSSIKRQYWTDRYNLFRSINLGDENLMAVDVDTLPIDLKITLRKPVLNRIQEGGQLLVGHYQVAYALRTLGGALSPYSHTSNSIFITDDALGNQYYLYNGADSAVVTNKSFRVKFTDIDTSFEYMDIVVLRKETANGPVFIDKVTEIPISSDVMYYNYTGKEESSSISEVAFTKLNNLFNRCHTVAQKDNTLFVGNTTGEVFNVNFDARAYRFNGAVTTGGNHHGLIDENTTPLSATDTQLLQSFGIAEDSDAINPDQEIYRYQSDGNTLGGEGPNISYKFHSSPRLTDARPYNTFSYTFPYRLPWPENDDTEELGDGIEYFKGGFWPDMKSPYTNHIYRGYRRGETYRFAWVPIKNGQEGYARWIGDIRMPDIFEDYQGGNLSSSANDNKIFPLLREINGVTDVNYLGVEFSVSIPPDIAEQIDGWRIKRVKLEESDRTVIAQGLVHITVNNTITNSHHPALGNDSGFNPPNDNFTMNSAKTFADNASAVAVYPGNKFSPLITFHSPDLLFGRPLEHRTGDRIKLVQALIDEDNVSLDTYNHLKAWKLYKACPIPSTFTTEQEVIRGISIGRDDDILINNYNFENRSIFIPSFNGRRSRGIGTTVLLLDGGLDSSATYDVENSGINFFPAGFLNTAHKYIANYIRENTGQYGGKGYSARSRNQYINTGCEVVLKDDGIVDHTVKVYGGDTFVNVFDSIKMTKNYDPNELSGNNHRRAGVAVLYPVESFVNTDMREGYSLNGNQNPSGYFHPSDDPASGEPDPELFALDYGEDFKYNYVFSEQMDTQRSFPMPLNTNIETAHPVRIWASGTKVYGELTDSWRMFDNERYIDIQGDLGEIRQLLNVNEQLVAWQKRGMGVASVNERSVINDASGNGIILGQSGVLPRFDYISQSIGSWHQFGFAKGPNSVMFFDMKNGGIYLYSSEGLKDVSEGKIKGWLYENTRKDILNNDSPIAGQLFNAGICATYDQRNKEYLITFHDTDIVGLFRTPRAFTLAYDPRYDRFVSYRSYTPKMYINNEQHVMSTDPSDLNKLYIHDIGDRGVFFDNPPSTSSITIIPNSHPNYSKVFDNTRWYSEVYDSNGNEVSAETFSDVEVFNPYQTTGLRTDIKKLLREWKFTILYQLGTKNRIRNHYCRQRFNFPNNNNKEFKLYYITNIFRIFTK